MWHGLSCLAPAPQILRVYFSVRRLLVAPQASSVAFGIDSIGSPDTPYMHHSFDLVYNGCNRWILLFDFAPTPDEEPTRHYPFPALLPANWPVVVETRLLGSRCKNSPLPNVVGNSKR